MNVDKATDELAEVLADFDLSDEEVIEVRQTIRERVLRAQKYLLK